MATIEGKRLTALLRRKGTSMSARRREIWKRTSRVTLELSFLQTLLE
jgi:hypothetical protein